jgi:hypothetical protein
VNVTATIAATPKDKTLIEFVLFQDVADPTDSPMLVATEAPFSISYTPTRLGTARFAAIAVYSDKTFTEVPLIYTLAPSGSPASLAVSLPSAALPVGLSTPVSVQALFAGGPVDATAQSVLSTLSGASKVFSVGSNGTITATGKGVDALKASYGGLTISAPVTVGSCSFVLEPASQFIPYAGGTADIQVTTQEGCSWAVDAGRHGTGNGVIPVNLGPNTTEYPVVKTITLGDSSAVVIQPAVDCPTTFIGPSEIKAPAAGAAGTIAVDFACPPFFDWLAVSPSQPWVWAAAGSSSPDGNPTILYSVAPNTGASPRTAKIYADLGVVTITQEGAAAKTGTPTGTGTD